MTQTSRIVSNESGAWIVVHPVTGDVEFSATDRHVAAAVADQLDRHDPAGGRKRRVGPADLEPGMSVFDEAFVWRARFVHSVERVSGDARRVDEEGRRVPTWQVRFGHPDGDPEDDPEGIGLVGADREYTVVAYADGNRPA
jgi:hypothetical protein